MPSPMSTVISGADLTNGLRATFTDAYMKPAQQSPLLDKVMEIVPSDARQQIYSYPTTAPYPGLWQQGQGIPEGNFTYVQFTVPNFRYGRRIAWEVDDREDGQTDSLYSQAQTLGQHWATLPERLFFENLLGTASVLPAISNAPDGLAAISSSTRFGVSGGNTNAGAGVATGAAIRTDFWNVVVGGYFRMVQDTEGQPYFTDAELDQGYVIIHGPALTQVMAEAFKQGRTLQTVVYGSNTAAAGGAVTNTILESGVPISLWCTQRLSGNSWYAIALGAKKKPFFHQVRKSVAGTYANDANSDIARDYNQEYIQFKSRGNVAPFLPFGLFRIGS